ncbi:hypothetical protein RQP46_009589 [Phenoliferia psychrophenolica]
MTGAQHLFARLPFWVQILLDTPTTDEGGPLGFTYTDKLNDLRTVVKALHSIGWSFERLARPAPFLAREIQVLADRARLYHSVMGTRIDPEWALPPDNVEEVDIEALLASLTEGIYEHGGRPTPPAVEVDDHPVVAMFSGFFGRIL